MNPDEFWPYYPTGVNVGGIITSGGNNFIAIFNGDKDTVLKFPLVPRHDTGDYTEEGRSYRQKFRDLILNGLDAEARILEVLGHYHRIIRFHGRHEDGLVLEYMRNGSVETYLRHNPGTSADQRLKWALHAAEGLAYIHSKNVLHCDISVGNLLLDSGLNINFCDFQGRLLDPDGKIIVNGGALEGIMSSMPRPDPNICNQKSDIFALGTAIFFMATGQMPFPDLAMDALEHEDEIGSLFKTGEFPFLDGLLVGDIVKKCWKGAYESAVDLVLELQELQIAPIS